MYARKYDESGEIQTFNRGEYNIPANYSGNAFIADEPPEMSECTHQTSQQNIPDHPEKNKMPESEDRSSNVLSENPSGLTSAAPSATASGTRRGGIIGGLLSKFDRGFEFDDLLIIGLIILLIQQDKKDCAKTDDIILILAILFLMGF